MELGQGAEAVRIPILYEDRAVIAIDKPRGWMLVPFTWQKTDRNLQAAIQSSIGSGAFWARSRHVKFLRYVHRLDADTTGVLLFAKSIGATNSLGDLFETRQMHKRYLAIVRGIPKHREWSCTLRLDKDPARIGRMLAHPQRGKEAETDFRVLESRGDLTLVEALPVTGRTHQIRVHLAETGHPILGDDLYGGAARVPLALRAVELSYRDPFIRKDVRIRAPDASFLAEYGFGKPAATPTPATTEGTAATASAAEKAADTRPAAGPAGPAGPGPRPSQAPPLAPSSRPPRPSQAPTRPRPERPRRSGGPGSQDRSHPHPARSHGRPKP
jgi:23S rRNA pseudouridine1911/1915/1917 synthase